MKIVALYISIILLVLLLACKGKKPVDQELTSADTAAIVIVQQDTSSPHPVKLAVVPADTVISYDIMDVSLEGSEANVHYIKGRIRDVKWEIFGETGQATIYYNFLPNGTVKVREKRSSYDSGMQYVRSDKDMHLKKIIEYQLDTNGVLLSKTKDIMSVFEEFKKVVPLDLH